LPGLGQALPDELAGAIDRRAHLGLRLVALGKHPRGLKCNRGPGERMREDVVKLGRDPNAFRDRRGASLFIASVLELREQHLGLVLTVACLCHEVSHQPEQNTQQRGGQDPCRRAPGNRRSDIDRDRYRSAERDPGQQRQPRNRRPHRRTRGKLGGASRLECSERHPGGTVGAVERASRCLVEQ
jgi:hypothetical protein